MLMGQFVCCLFASMFPFDYWYCHWCGWFPSVRVSIQLIRLIRFEMEILWFPIEMVFFGTDHSHSTLRSFTCNMLWSIKLSGRDCELTKHTPLCWWPRLTSSHAYNSPHQLSMFWQNPFSLFSLLSMAGHGARRHGHPDRPLVPAGLGPSLLTATCPARQCHLPVWYQGFDVENKEGEIFDIHHDSSPPRDSESDSAPQALDEAAATQHIVDTVTTLAVNTAQTDPFTTSQSETQERSQNTAFDIRHFFRKETEQTVCLPCE